MNTENLHVVIYMFVYSEAEKKKEETERYIWNHRFSPVINIQGSDFL